MIEHAIRGIDRAQRHVRGYLQRFDLAWRVRLHVQARLRDVQLDIGEQVTTVTKGKRAIRVATEFRPYIWEVINGFEWFFALVEPREEQGLLVNDFSSPREHVMRLSKVPFEFVGFPEDDAMSDLYLDLAGLHDGSVVFDGGAYCGASAYFFSKAVGKTGKVLAFEPDPRNYVALTHNVARHGLANVVPLQQGLWSRTTTLSFHAHGNMGSSIVEGAAPAPNIHSIEVTSIADAVARHRLERLDFVKLDIEGAEVKVVDAARDVLRRFRPRLVIETHYVDGVLTTQRLRDLFAEIGYRTQILLEAPGSPFHLIYAWPDGTAPRPNG